MTDWTSLRYAVVDVEGNGQQPPDLVELAVVPVVDGKIGTPMSWLVKPARPIKYFATRIHGITNQDVAEGLAADLTPHRAAYDALVTARLFVYLATITEGGPLTLEALRGELPGRSGHEAPSLF